MLFVDADCLLESSRLSRNHNAHEYAVEDDSAEQTARIREAFSHLTVTQQRRLRLYANGKTLREIASFPEVPRL